MAWLAWLADAGQDIRFAWRGAARGAGVGMVSVLVLGCGIGLALAIFTLADTVLRRPLPVRDESGVVALWGTVPGSLRTIPLTLQHFERYRREARTLGEVAGTVSVDAWPQVVRDGDSSFRANLSPVTGNFFRVLGSTAMLGRLLNTADDHAGAEPVAVISYSLWRGWFGGSPDVLGRRIALQNSRVLTVVGVAPPGLEYPTRTEVWLPFSMFAVPEVTPLGRLNSGARARDAAAELRASFEREPSGAGLRGANAAATPVRRLVVGDFGPALLVLTMAAALLLVAACLNVGGLLLVRGISRRPEIAVRRALGASRGRILRQLTAETLPIAIGAGALAAWVAMELLRGLIALAPPELPRIAEIQLQGLSVGFATLVGGAAVLAASLLPAFWLSDAAESSLRAGRRSVTALGSVVSIQRAIVTLQVGLAVLVLFVAGLLVRTLQHLQAIDTGFAVERLAIVELSWPDATFATSADVAAFYERLLARLGSLPEVVSASPVNVVPFTGAIGGWDGSFVADGQPGKTPVFNLAVVGSSYFDTMGISLRQGRGFSDADRGGSAAVAIVSEDAARELWPDQNPLGKRLRFGDATGGWRTVIGVAPEIRYRAIRQSAPTVYLPARQFLAVFPLVTTVAVRTHGSPGSALALIRQAVQQTDRNVTVLKASTMSGLVAGEFATPRLSALLVSVFGIGAVLLSAVGLYAVLAASVRDRRRELAIRHAVGATPGRLRALVLYQALRMCILGLVLGLVVAFAISQLLQNVLFEVSPHDAPTVASVVAVLVAVAALAGYFPARRATEIDPVEVLREQ
jgi:putative ABC transport system permease protein